MISQDEHDQQQSTHESDDQVAGKAGHHRPLAAESSSTQPGPHKDAGQGKGAEEELVLRGTLEAAILHDRADDRLGWSKYGDMKLGARR